MIHAQNHRVVAELPTAAVGATATATLTIDTLGYDHASVTVIRASNASTVFANAVKVEESDSVGSGYTDVVGLVGGAASGFSIPAIAVSATGSASILKMDVDTKAKKRYLRVSYTPGASATVAIVGRLGRPEVSPENAAQANVIGLVRG